VRTEDVGGGANIATPDEKEQSEKLGRERGCGVGRHRSGRPHLALYVGRPDETVHTFAILALSRERTRNLNLSSSVCTMTSLKFAEGSAVAFIVSMASILRMRISMSCLTLGEDMRKSTNLFSDSLHRPINQLGGIGQQLWCCPLVDPCSRESL
jgi:hypothetical protein